MVFLLVFAFLLILASVSYSHVYIVDINNFYKLKYGNRIIPIIREVSSREGRNYLYNTGSIGTSRDFVFAYISPSLKTTTSMSGVNYTELFVLTGYKIIQ